MATEAQLVANRRNCLRSTGPRTGQGKAIACQNSVKHGLTARQDVIRQEDQAEFDRHRERLLADLAPAGPVESMLAERIVRLSWRLERTGRIQNQTIDTLVTGAHLSPLARLSASRMPKVPSEVKQEAEADGADLTLGCMAAKDFGRARVLDRLLLYERRIESSLYRSMLEIQRCRLIRQLDPTQGQDDCAPDRVSRMSSF